MIGTLLGGIGLFLLGMILLTDGLKALAGDALRRLLARFTGGRFASLMSGTVVTVLVQSSSATTLMTIGFVSAGLLTFSQAVGVIFGSNLGTTSTGWLVSLLGLKFSIVRIAMPVIGVGALLRLLTRDRWAAFGLVLAGFGLLFVGIDALQAAMKDVAGRITPDMVPGDGWTSRALLVGLGVLMTVVLQSSSAAVATTLAALDAGAIGLTQAGALVIGQNIGTTVTAGLGSIGASVPAKRTAMAHVLFNLLTGLIAYALLTPFVAAVKAFADAEAGGSGPVALAAFHTLFNLLGVAIFLPWIGKFSDLVCRLVKDRGPVLTQFLDDKVAALSPVAVEAARRTIRGILVELTGIAKGLLESARPAPEELSRVEAALRATREFLGRVRTSAESALEHRRHISVLHALDHAERLAGACAEVGLARSARTAADLAEMRAALAGSVDRAAAWLADTKPGKGPVDDLARVSRDLAESRRTRRAGALERTARAELAPQDALASLEAMRWIDRVGYHIWRSVAHLQEPPPEAPAGGAEQPFPGGAGPSTSGGTS